MSCIDQMSASCCMSVVSFFLKVIIEVEVQLERILTFCRDDFQLVAQFIADFPRLLMS